MVCSDKKGKTKNQRAPIGASRAKPQKLAEVDLKEQARIYVPMGEFSRVLGGGLVPGSISLIGGEPGIGKCLTGDMRVFNPITGDYLPIQDIVEGQHESSAYLSVSPFGLLPTLKEAIEKLLDTEQLILGPAREEGFNFEKLEAAWSAFEKSRT